MGKTITPHESVRNSLVIKPDADVQASVLEQLEKSNTNFKATDKRQRRAKDNSASTCEAIIADIAVSIGLDVQTICNLIIRHKRRNSDDFVSDPTYYERTIAAARARAAVAQKLQSYDAGKEHSREEALADLSTVLGVSVSSIQRFATDPPAYVMRLANGKYVEFKDSDQLFGQSTLRKALRDYARTNLPPFKNDEWHNVENCILKCIEDVESASESTHLGATVGWLRAYLRKHLRPDMPRDGQINAAIEGKPAVMDGHVWFSMDGLRRSIMLESSEQPPSKEILAVRLRQIGCTYQPQVSLRPSGSPNTSRSLWFAPDNLMSDEELKSL